MPDTELTCFDCGEVIQGTPVEVRWSGEPWLRGPVICEDCAIDYEEAEALDT